MGLKRALEGVYGRQVNHGQLYPGLSDLVEHGLLRTRLDNQRTSYYEFTDRGRRALTGYAHYLASAAAVAGADVAWPHQPVGPVGDTDADLSIRGDGRRSRLPGVERDGDREHGSGREPDEEGER
jgi:DNA-binding PadR family transcriptional regulator